jgi:osmotically inducible lipoprotein OsmB
MMMRTIRYSVLILVTGAMVGCAGMTETQQRTVSGGAIGAAGGAALGAITGGSPAVGAAVGGAAGVLGGFILGETNRKK